MELKLNQAIGQSTLQKTKLNPDTNVVEITKNVRPNEVKIENKLVLDKLKQDRLNYIRKIFDLILQAETPDLKKHPFWYGDNFDILYDKDISELKLMVVVFRTSRGKRYI